DDGEITPAAAGDRDRHGNGDGGGGRPLGRRARGDHVGAVLPAGRRHVRARLHRGATGPGRFL
ncbi:MAG: hypothetical protein AVDCRST_MAG79-2946, partial [uncultured Thermoleophilia bacterium]